jgi:hypothetical protein
LAFGATMLAGCAEERATAEDCGAIFDRIVALELAEMGYRDPALVERKRAELGRRLSVEVSACEGRPLSPGARACVAAATSAEEVVHRCLH